MPRATDFAYGTTDDCADAIAAGPALLHVDRGNAALHPAQSLGGSPPRSGYDREDWCEEQPFRIRFVP